MKCGRCQGLMVAITLEDTRGSSRCVNAWQCLLCGDVLDSEIAANRESHHQPRRFGPRLQGHVNRTT